LSMFRILVASSDQFRQMKRGPLSWAFDSRDLREAHASRTDLILRMSQRQKKRRMHNGNHARRWGGEGDVSDPESGDQRRVSYGERGREGGSAQAVHCPEETKRRLVALTSIRRPVSIESETAALLSLKRMIVSMLGDYPTDVEDDRQRLASSPEEEDLLPFSNARNALIQVHSEKAILHLYLDVIDSAVRLLRSAAASDVKDDTPPPPPPHQDQETTAKSDYLSFLVRWIHIQQYQPPPSSPAP